MITLKEVVKILDGDYIIHIRRAFGDCDIYFEGLIYDIPKNFEYLENVVCAIYPFSFERGDVNWKNCTALDIAIGDFKVGEIKCTGI